MGRPRGVSRGAKTVEGSPCGVCGGTKRYLYGSCATRGLHPGWLEHTRRDGAERYSKPAEKERRKNQVERYRAEGTCINGGHPRAGKLGSAVGWKSDLCWKCINNKVQYKERQAAGMTQDLSQPCIFTYGTLEDGKRWVAAKLPIPGWSKHTRVSVAKTGGRFLGKAAKDYKAWMHRFFLFDTIERPWLRTEYALEFTSYTMRSDCDQWGGGLTDDLVSLGLAVDDKHCAGINQRRIRVKTKEDQRIEFRGMELHCG